MVTLTVLHTLTLLSSLSVDAGGGASLLNSAEPDSPRACVHPACQTSAMAHLPWLQTLRAKLKAAALKVGHSK